MIEKTTQTPLGLEVQVEGEGGVVATLGEAQFDSACTGGFVVGSRGASGVDDVPDVESQADDA